MKLSFRVAGKIIANGSLSTKIITFPCRRYFTAVYGFSALIEFGKKFLFSFSKRFLIVPAAIIPSMSIFFNSLSIFSTSSGLVIVLIYRSETLVLVYLPRT